MQTETKYIEPLWVDDDGFIAQGTCDTYKTFADTNVNDDDIDDREKRTDQIISAYNNTYAKGIKPESVPELAKSLQFIHNICQRLLERYALDDELTDEELYQQFRTAAGAFMEEIEVRLKEAGLTE